MLNDLVYILTHYVVTLLISVLFFPLAKKILGKTHAQGYAASRILGILIVTYLVWIISSFKLIPFGSVFVWVVLLLVGFVINFFIKEKINIKQVIKYELIYIFSFIFLLIYRVSNPDIKDIEKFMDFGILNGILRSSYFPPQDVWYSGEAINYYYYGHLTHAVIQKLTYIPPEIFYNISICFIFASAFTLAFYIGKTLTNKNIFGFFSACLVTLAGNLDILYKTWFLRQENYFYADARSLIPFTINEFPAYSFLISDLHAHIINIPFVLFFIASCINIFYLKRLSKLNIFIYALSLGSLFAINSWDFIIYTVLLLLIIVAKTLVEKNYINFLWFAVIFGLSLFIFIPFHLSFKPAVGGVGFVTDYSEIFAIFLMFGFFYIFNLSFVINFFYNFFKRSKITKKKLLILVLLISGLGLTLIPEFIFIKDIYYKANPPYYRANTVFKVWYQAWIILSIVTSYSIYLAIKNIKSRKIFFAFYLSFFCIIFVGIMQYYFYSVRYIVGAKFNYKGLDGQRYLSSVEPGRYATLVWINQNIKSQPVVLEAEGESYKTTSVISSFTGLPTVVGWRDHEFGWRDNWPELTKRMTDITTIYTTTSEEELNKMVNKYNIEYIVVGNQERTKYGELAGNLVSTTFNKIFESNDVVLYSIK